MHVDTQALTDVCTVYLYKHMPPMCKVAMELATCQYLLCMGVCMGFGACSVAGEAGEGREKKSMVQTMVKRRR